MVTKVQRWGNNQDSRLPKQLPEETGIGVGDAFEASAQDGVIVLKPVRRVRGRYKLKDLLAHIPADCALEEVSWGPPHGREVW